MNAIKILEKCVLFFIKLSNIQPPSSELFLRDKLMPHERLRGLLRESLGYKYRFLIEKTYVEVVEEKKIHLREISGCSASKNRYVDFHAMNVKGIKSCEEAFKIENAIFHGGHDCISRKNKNARVYKQKWDEGKWFCNAGGSHRGAALWQYDKENNIDRPIDCDLITVGLSDWIQDFSRDYYICIYQPKYYLFVFLAKTIVQLNKKLNKDIEINLLRFNNSSILLSKNSSLNEKFLKKMVSKSFDISEWILNPVPLGYDKDYCLDIKSQIGP